MSYRASKKGNYYQARTHSGSVPYFNGNKNPRNNDPFKQKQRVITEPRLTSNESIEQPTPSFAVLAKLSSWDQPSRTAKLSINVDIPTQAFQLAQAVSTNKGKIELQIMDPTTQKMMKFKVLKKELEADDLNLKQQPEDKTIYFLSQPAFEYIHALRGHLEAIGFSLQDGD